MKISKRTAKIIGITAAPIAAASASVTAILFVRRKKNAVVTINDYDPWDRR